MMEIDDNFSYLNATDLNNLTREEPKYIDISKEIAKDVQLKKITILEVIQRLGCLLLDQSFSKRDVGVLMLSETLHNVGTGVLNPEQLSVISSYFAEKLKDYHQVASSALRGVLAIVKFSNTPSESVVLLVTHIFNHIACQQQQQQDRYLIFQIYETVLNQHNNEVNSMGIDFVYGVLSSVDGERDPKNLIYLFNWLQTFLKTVKLGHLTEEMFEVLSCYFPVDFKAPPNDVNRVSREDLAQGLCKCITCIPDFGQYGIPMALEKLDSDLKLAKEDSLDVLKSGCKNYDTETYYLHSIELWSQIQKEIFNTKDVELIQKCLETLKEIVSKLSTGDQKNFETTILDIADTLKGNMMPDSKLFSKSANILVFIARASEVSSVLVAKKVAPLLENTFKITTSPKLKSTILHTFIEFVKAVIETNGAKVDINSIEEIAGCSVLCSQAILDRDPDLVIAGFRGFSEILQFIPENVRHVFLDNLREALVAPLPSSVKQAVLKCLEKIAETSPQEVEKHILQKDALCDIVTIDNYLQGISYIVKLPYFETYVIDTIIGYATVDIHKSTVALKHLTDILSKSEHCNEILVQREFIPKLIGFLASLDDTETLDKDFLSSINNVLQNLIRKQDAPFQKDVYASQLSRSFKSQNIYVTVLSSLIVSVQRGVFEDFDKIDFLLDCSLNATEEFIRNISLEVLANVVNKIDNEPVLEGKLNKIKMACDGCNLDTKVWIISWVTKGLVTRNHPKAWQWTDLLLSCLPYNVEAATGFSIIMNESPVLSKENHCQIMPLYRQKFFVYCANKLNENSQNEDEANFNVIGYLIENAPRVAVVGHFKKILRVILLCLEKSKESRVLEILLRRITEFIANGESVIEDNLEDILLRVLDLTIFESSMTVRISAIRCLHQITVTYRVYQLLPHRQKVVQQLGICVDDRKRLVRREAMECRSLWYLLDAPV